MNFLFFGLIFKEVLIFQNYKNQLVLLKNPDFYFQKEYFQVLNLYGLYYLDDNSLQLKEFNKITKLPFFL
jgi:hypothetical protein